MKSQWYVRILFKQNTDTVLYSLRRMYVNEPVCLHCSFTFTCDNYTPALTHTCMHNKRPAVSRPHTDMHATPQKQTLKYAVKDTQTSKIYKQNGGSKHTFKCVMMHIRWDDSTDIRDTEIPSAHAYSAVCRCALTCTHRHIRNIAVHWHKHILWYKRSYFVLWWISAGMCWNKRGNHITNEWFGRC